MSTTCWAKALPSFVAGGTNTTRIRQPLMVSRPRDLTRAFGYQAGPLTTLAALRSALGAEVITRGSTAGVVLDPTPQARPVKEVLGHVRPGPMIPSRQP